MSEKITDLSEPIKKTIENSKTKKTVIKNYNIKSKINKASSSNVNPKTAQPLLNEAAPKEKAIQKRFTKNPIRNLNSNKSLKSVKIIFLGGLNQIGKNITAFEFDNDIIIVDCGMSFPDGEMLGIDLVIPDFSYLEANKEKIRGLVVTHAHEDHIGAIPYLLNKINVPLVIQKHY